MGLLVLAVAALLALPGSAPASGHAHHGTHANRGNHCGQGHAKHSKKVGQSCQKLSRHVTGPPGGGGYPSLTPPFTFDGDFDPSCQLIGGEGGWSALEGAYPQNPSGDYPGTASIDTTTFAEGSCAGKFGIPAGSGTGRAEVEAPQVSTPVSVTWEELFYIPSVNGPNGGSLSQTKQGSSCFNGAVGFDETNGLFISTVASCSSGSVMHTIINPVPLDHWFAVKVAETFSDSGSVRAWYDPDGPGPAGYTEEVPLTNTDTLSGSGLKLRQGLYHDQQSTEQHVYGDGFHMDCLASC